MMGAGVRLRPADEKINARPKEPRGIRTAGRRNQVPAEPLYLQQKFGEARSVMEREASGKPVLNPVEARQGFLGRPVLVVLTVSTVLAAVILGILIIPTLSGS
jgi:hypothetical protein